MTATALRLRTAAVAAVVALGLAGMSAAVHADPVHAAQVSSSAATGASSADDNGYWRRCRPRRWPRRCWIQGASA
jgi:hypothetical protein